jgi:hypothetical protein
VDEFGLTLERSASEELQAVSENETLDNLIEN